MEGAGSGPLGSAQEPQKRAVTHSPNLSFAPPAETRQVKADTRLANRGSALCSYLDACRNLSKVPEPELVAELEAMTNYYRIDPTDDAVLIEVASSPGTLGSYGEGAIYDEDSKDAPVLAGMTVEGLIHVTLTYREDGLPVIGLQNLTESDFGVVVENSEAAGHLYRGVIPCS